MGKTRPLPARLAGIQQRFERWRNTRKGLSQIPEPLWTAAVRMARTYGICRTAQTLGVNYAALKKRVEHAAALPASVAPAAAGRLPTNGRSSFETHCRPTSAGSSGRRIQRNSGKTAANTVRVPHAARRYLPVVSSAGGAGTT